MCTLYEQRYEEVRDDGIHSWFVDEEGIPLYIWQVIDWVQLKDNGVSKSDMSPPWPVHPFSCVGCGNSFWSWASAEDHLDRTEDGAIIID